MLSGYSGINTIAWKYIKTDLDHTFTSNRQRRMNLSKKEQLGRWNEDQEGLLQLKKGGWLKMQNQLTGLKLLKIQ